MIKNRVCENMHRNILSYLNRFCDEIRDIGDVIRIVDSSTSRKNMVIALRNFINFLEEIGAIAPEFANKLRKPLKVVRSNVDAFIPSDKDVINAYKKFDKEKYRIVFKILLYSGIRITETMQFINGFDRSRLMINGKIAKYPLFADRQSKNAYFVYLPAKFAKELKKTKVTLSGCKNYFSRRKLPPKYLRKWQYNFLILNGVPESVADFIQGRASITVGSMHYLAKVKQADEFYAKVVDKFPI